MKRRFTRLPIASIAVVIGSLLVGLSMSPAGAQSGLANGQVTVRSDGAVYLISNGTRRWVATVVISDEELNAYPEAAPIYAGLVPFGSAPPVAKIATGTTATKSTATKTTASKSTSSSKSSSSSASDDDDDDDDSTAAGVDPTGQAKPTGETTCPDSHMVKGGFDKKYYDIDRPVYLTVEVEACFRTGKDARDAKYTEAK